MSTDSPGAAPLPPHVSHVRATRVGTLTEMPVNASAREISALAATLDPNVFQHHSAIDADDVFTHLMLRHHAAGSAMAAYAAEHGEHAGVEQEQSFAEDRGHVLEQRGRPAHVGRESGTRRGRWQRASATD